MFNLIFIFKKHTIKSKRNAQTVKRHYLFIKFQIS